MYLNGDECWFNIFDVPKQRFKLQFFLNYAVIPENEVYERINVLKWTGPMSPIYLIINN